MSVDTGGVVVVSSGAGGACSVGVGSTVGAGGAASSVGGVSAEVLAGRASVGGSGADSANALSGKRRLISKVEYRIYPETPTWRT